MGSFVFIGCSNFEDKRIKKNSFLLVIKKIYYRLFKKIDFSECTSKFDTGGEDKIWLIDLNSMQDHLLFNYRKLENDIAHFNKLNNINSCFYQKRLSEEFNFKNTGAGKYKGDILFRSLLKEIVIKICEEYDIELGRVEMCIMSHSFTSDMLEIARLFSQDIRFLTIISPDYKLIEEEIDQLSDDCGLSVRMTDDFCCGFERSEFIISIDGIIPNSSKKSKNSFIINLAGTHSGRLNSRTVNKIEVKLPQNLEGLKNSLLADDYTSQQLAEIIILHKLGIENAKGLEQIGGNYMKIISREFIESGYRIIDTGLFTEK